MGGISFINFQEKSDQLVPTKLRKYNSVFYIRIVNVNTFCNNKKKNIMPMNAMGSFQHPFISV